MKTTVVSHQNGTVRLQIDIDICDGEHQHTTYFGAAPEHGKATFLKRFERELERVKSQYPGARYLGIADGAKDNGSFLKLWNFNRLFWFRLS